MSRLQEWPAEIDVDSRLLAQLQFILEVDKLKHIMRKTPLLDRSRTESDAEHCWELALMAAILAEHAEASVNIGRVILMLLIHDLVEIDAGDTFLYDDSAMVGQLERERKAADRIFGMLPTDQGRSLRILWEEFEERASPDAIFAATLDRLQPLLHNFFSGGGTWHHPGVTAAKVRSRKSIIGKGSTKLWDIATQLIREGVRRGYLRPDPISPRTVAVSPSALRREFQRIGASPLSSETPPEVRQAVDVFTRRYQAVFKTVTRFPLSTLHVLHAEDDRPLPSTFTIGSTHDPSIVSHIETLTTVANMSAPTIPERRAYFDALLSIYRKLPLTASKHALALADTLCIAPEREGRILAQALGYFPGARSFTLQAKRILMDGEMLVALGELSAPGNIRRCVIIDGAIASGVTIMAMIHKMAPAIHEWHVISAHAADSSLVALARFASLSGIDLHLTVGHSSGALNEKFYAVAPANGGRPIIGDVGDMISKVAS